MIVLGEGVVIAEKLLIELHGFNGDLEDELCLFVHHIVVRFCAVQRHRKFLHQRLGTLYCLLCYKLISLKFPAAKHSK
jgi:hypothetical protein